MDRSTLSAFVSVIGAKAVILLVGILSTPILVRLFTQTQYGDFAFVFSLFSLLMIVVSSGVGDGVRKFLAEDADVDHWEQHVVGFFFQMALLFSLVGAALLVLGGYFLSGRFFKPIFQTYFIVLGILVVAAQFNNFSRRVLMGFGLERISEPLGVLDRALLWIIGLTLVYFGFGVTGLLTGFILSGTVVSVLGIVAVRDRISLWALFTPTPSGFPKREFMTYNVLNVALILLLTSLYHVDILMLQPIGGSGTLGVYKGALKIAEFLWFVPMAIQSVLLHSTSELWSKDATEEITQMATRTTRFVFLTTALLALGLGALADIVVPLYLGESYTPAVVPLLILLPGALGFALARPILAIGQGNGAMKPLLLATGTAAVINLGLNALLIPRYRMIGAAVATSVGYGSMFVFHAITARHIGFDALADIRPVALFVTVTVSGAAIFGLNAALSQPYLRLLVVPPAGFAVFTALTILTGAIDERELAPIFDRLPVSLSS
ncbi:Membrane protein involved in the export of O-antigen and teichoic acid [Halogranum amylolyticum]|uniref:Membrane protein involved in the export of O-antigen and teichoic acid n=1 Tax=Halogranum amylolyticum TaxID=660520 RepID=A0A1H8V517_9EURY|nr:polysaccharide biosynthesis C-terminal domain-containing protein [Halogranum amylolyticum]SEP10333.1 Membrane protein involved in the export of O-antigen and teichoic acid [Halogranum amylolyticum]